MSTPNFDYQNANSLEYIGKQLNIIAKILCELGKENRSLRETLEQTNQILDEMKTRIDK